MKAPLTRIILALAIAEVAYLVLANLALNLPLTQSMINQHRPDKYAVYWERAWSWYPLRVHARGVSVNGQTSSQQWQADVSAASASLSVFPLFQRTVKIQDVDVRDVAFRLRPRPKPEKDYAATRVFFPPIRDREPDLPAVEGGPAKEGSGWRIVVDDIHAGGSHDIWVFQVRGALLGDMHANVTFETRGGPVSLSGGDADVKLNSLVVNKDREVSSGGILKGRFELAPFVPSENPGFNAMGFLSVDADIDAPVDSLGFLDFYLRGFGGMEIDGNGRLNGRLRYERGNLSSGSDLNILANALALNAPPYELKGAGGIGIAVEPEDPETLSIEILFGALHALHQDDVVPLFSGTGLKVVVRGTTRVLPDAAREAGGGRLAVTIPSVQVSDLRAYQRYLPDKWPVELKGGHGSLHGHAEYSASDLSAVLNLVSEDADILVKDYRFKTNLELGLKVSGGTSESANVDLSGTFLRLDEARLASDKKGASKPWQATFTIASGRLGIPIAEGEGEASGFRHLAAVLKQEDLKDLLASADAQLNASLEVSDLGWINLLFENPFELAISGAGEVQTNMVIRDGWFAKGTALDLEPKGLQVQVLDYVAQGDGTVSLRVEQGGERPDMRLDAQLGDALLRRRGEKDAVVEQVKLEVSAVAKDVAIGGGSSVTELDVRIPSAHVKDMTVYNQYLPKDAPLKLLGGEAELTADVHLEPKSAGGFVKLKTEGLRSRLDDQEVSGELSLDIALHDGVPKDMVFDISGSSLLLDGFKVVGEQRSFDQSGWQARFDLNKAHVVWNKPMRLDVEAEIEMKDSRPIVALFANHRGKHGWLEKMLTVEDISGNARLKVEAERALIPFALVGSDKIDVGAKGLVDASTREAIFYARFRKLHGILKMKDGERNFDILGARRKFDDYSPGETPLGLTAGGPSAASDTSRDAGQQTRENLFLQ